MIGHENLTDSDIRDGAIAAAWVGNAAAPVISVDFAIESRRAQLIDLIERADVIKHGAVIVRYIVDDAEILGANFSRKKSRAIHDTCRQTA